MGIVGTMNHKSLAVASAALLIGIAIGSIGTGFYLKLKQIRDKQTFEQKIRCEQISKEYEKSGIENSFYIYVQGVTYSPVRNSCIAKILMQSGDLDYYYVQDLITHELIASSNGSCNRKNGECANGEDGKLIRRRENAFDQLR